MTMRNIILFYVQHHPGCEVKNVAADIDFAYQTIGTSLDVAVKKGECTSTGMNPKQYFSNGITLTDEEKSIYVHAVIRKHKNVKRDELCKITGLNMYVLDKTLQRLRNLGKVKVRNGYGVKALVEYEIPKDPGNIKPAHVMTALEQALAECTK